MHLYDGDRAYRYIVMRRQEHAKRVAAVVSGIAVALALVSCVVFGISSCML